MLMYVDIFIDENKQGRHDQQMRSFETDILKRFIDDISWKFNMIDRSELPEIFGNGNF